MLMVLARHLYAGTAPRQRYQELTGNEAAN